MSTPGMPQPADSSNVGQAQGQSQGDPLQDFRQLAQQVQSLGQKYPEFTQSAVAILKQIQEGMTRVAGSPQRTPPKDAPPMA